MYRVCGVKHTGDKGRGETTEYTQRGNGRFLEDIPSRWKNFPGW